jgi:ion channel POLLUX/CASTOR
MNQKTRFSDRLRYAVDNAFSKGSGTLILWLSILSVVIISVIALVVSLFRIAPDGETPLNFWEAFWRSLMRTLDAGTMGGDAGWGFRIAMLVVTIGGVFVISTLIGILSSAIEGKLDDLRKGRSRILEENHTIILGWSSQISIIVSELIAANANLKSSCIAILSKRDKVEMDEFIKDRIGDSGTTKIVTRSGDPMEMSDLSLVSINTSRSIIILSAEESDDPDAEVLKSVLAITNHPKRRVEPYHIIAEIRNPRNAEITQIVGKNELEIVKTGEIISRIIAQTCRQSGLSVVYTELLDFGGDEIYLKRFPEFAGKIYREVLGLFNKNTVMGICTAGKPAQLNPPLEYVLTDSDNLILIAEDDDKIFADGKFIPQDELIVHTTAKKAKPEATILMGWNWKGTRIIRELDNYVPADSTITVVASGEHLEATIKSMTRELRNLKIKFIEGDITDRKLLEGLNLTQYDHIILLCYSDEMDPQKADARTMMTLLHLRDIEQKKETDFSIVSEMLDIRNRNLAEVSQADDFIVSDKLISLMLAQVSENKQLNSVFQDIFDPEGAEIYLKPVASYVMTGTPVNFYTLIKAAQERGETAIGYRLVADAKQADKGYGVHLNPDKSAEVVFTPSDKIIVLAEE